MRVFYSERHEGLLVCLKIDGVEFLAKFKKHSYVPPNDKVERALLFHPAFEEMYYDIEEVEEYITKDISAVVCNFNGIMNAIKLRFMNVAIEDFKKAQVVIVWQDLHNVSCVEESKERGIPTICVQHGFAASRSYINFLEYRPFYYKSYDNAHKPGIRFDRKTNMVGYDGRPLLADIFCAWSDADKNQMVDGGVDPRRVEVIGCPVLRPDHKKPRKDNGGCNVLFAPHRELPRQQEYENKILIEQLAKIKGINLKIKLKNELKIDHYSGFEVVSSRRESRVHIEMIYDLIDWANVVVEPFFSTLSLIACHSGVEAINFNWGEAFPVEELPRIVRESLRRGSKYVNEDTRKLYDKWSGLSAGNPADNVYKIAKRLVTEKNRVKFQKRREAFACEV